jgi:hypothetical protein
MTLSQSEREVLAEARRIKARTRKAAAKARPARVQPTAPGQRQPRKREPAFLAFLRRQPCCVGPLGCSGSVEAAHIRFGRPGSGNAGMQRKPDDRDAVPLCRGHHRDGPDAQHRTNERAWWAAHGIDPHAYADVLHHNILEGQS